MVSSVTHQELILDFTRLTEVYQLPVVETGFVFIIDCVSWINKPTTAFSDYLFNYRIVF